MSTVVSIVQSDANKDAGGCWVDVINVYHQWTTKKQEVIIHDVGGADPVSRGLHRGRVVLFPGFQPALWTWDSQALQSRELVP